MPGGNATSRTLVILQSGGPTAVLNASLAGAISEAHSSHSYQTILGARRGFEGLLNESFINLGELSSQQLNRLRRTPSAALGTSRHRPNDGELDQILEVAGKYDIDSVLAIGGNDTADTAWRLVKRADERRALLGVITLPKTIDNDLVGTDHSLGYGSAARFIAQGVRDAAFDTLATSNLYPIKIVEVMGRNAGWLAAAGTLALDGALPQPIICLPERPFDSFTILSDRVAQRIGRGGYALLVVPETMRWTDGAHVAGTVAEWIDQFGHPYFPSAGHALSKRFSQELGIRARYDKPGTISRMSMHSASGVDLAEAEQAGIVGVQRLAAGETGTMVSLERVSSDPYRVRYGAAPVSQVANVERQMPDEMINSSGDGVSDTFIDYARPLVGEPFEPYEVLS